MRDSGRPVAPASRRWKTWTDSDPAKHRRDAGATRLSDHWGTPRITQLHLAVVRQAVRPRLAHVDRLGQEQPPAGATRRGRGQDPREIRGGLRAPHRQEVRLELASQQVAATAAAEPRRTLHPKGLAGLWFLETMEGRRHGKRRSIHRENKNKETCDD